MMLVYYLLPLLILWLPLVLFISRHEKLKLYIVIAISTIAYACSNYIKGHMRSKKQSEKEFTQVICAYAEEYFYLILKIITTFLWTFLCMRWTIYSIYLKSPNVVIFHLVRYFGIISIGLLTLFVWAQRDPEIRRLCVYLPITACIWFVAGCYITRRFFLVGISVFVPTLYFYYIDVIPNHNRIKQLNKKPILIIPLLGASLHLVLLAHQFLFHVIIVFTAAAFDKSKTMLDTFYPTEYLDLRDSIGFKRKFIGNGRRLVKGLFANEIKFPASVIEDIEVCVTIFDRTTQHFPINIYVFPSDILQDGAITYAFCRIIDDVIDSNVIKEAKLEMLAVTREFLDHLYQGYPTTKESLWKLIYQSNDFKKSAVLIDWQYFEKKLSVEQLSVFRSFTKIFWYIPRDVLDRLLEGFEIDVEKRQMKDECDLIKYCNCVGRNPISLTALIYCHKWSEWPDDFGPKTELLMQTAGNAGVILQLFDISQDIVDDGRTGRCYIPLTYFPNEEYKFITEQQNAMKINDEILVNCVAKLMALVRTVWIDCEPGIRLLPLICRPFAAGGLKIFLYEEEMKVTSRVYKNHKNLSTFKKMVIGFKSIVLRRNSNLLKIKDDVV